LDIGVLGYIGIVQHKEHSPEVLSIPPGTPCIYYAVDGTDYNMLWNGSDKDQIAQSECEEDEGTDCEDADSDTDS